MRSARGWTVLSPDGVPIEPRTYPYALAALGALEAWRARFAGQGSYACADGRRIPIADLADHCVVVPPAARPRRLRRSDV